MEKKRNIDIPKDKFRFVQVDAKLHDAKFETRPIGYFRDAWIRFRKNKASVVAAVIILLILLFTFLAPLLTQYTIQDSDGIYKRARPKVLSRARSGFWDGGTQRNFNERYLIFSAAVGMGAEDPEGTGKVSWEEGMSSKYSPIISIGEQFASSGNEYWKVRVDTYHEVGFTYQSVQKEEYERILAWQNETGIRVLYPMIDTRSKYMDEFNKGDANYWFRHAPNGQPLNNRGKRMSLEDVQQNGLLDNYLRDDDGNVIYFVARDRGMLGIRVLYYNYYQYKNGYEPVFHLGADAHGYDIMVRMASGIQVSILIAVLVSIINLTIGALYGAIEGYYGGWVDLTMERIADILNGIPFIVVATLFQLHLVNTNKVSAFVGLLFAFCLTGWLGTAYRVRTQFYRFKNQEYILAARTLGAKDARLMFKHIFPNALGTIITSSVLVIPGVILSESILSYLGIVNFNSKHITSLGTLLSNGQPYLRSDPHIVAAPAIIISLLMISFNLFGNGLRDAFNPSLRGADD